MLITTRGIVFRTIKYSESSIIADIYTEARGLQSYYINGIRSEKAKLKAGLFQPMSLLEIVAYAREDKSLNRIREARLTYAYQSIPFDVRKGAIVLFMAEVVRKTIREIEPNPELFAFLMDTLLFLDQTQERFYNVHLWFLVRLSGYLGFLPGGDFLPESPCFNLKEGAFCSSQRSDPWILEEEPSSQLYRLLELDCPQAQTIPLTRNQRQRLLNQILEYYRLHMDHLPDIQSHTILHEIF